MESVTLAHAKEHLEELIERASKGEDVRISDAKGGAVRLTPVPDASERVSRKARRLGLLEGRMEVPKRLMEPMSEEDLRDWYGDDA